VPSRPDGTARTKKGFQDNPGTLFWGQAHLVDAALDDDFLDFNAGTLGACESGVALGLPA
jgi:hypothetical protein